MKIDSLILIVACLFLTPSFASSINTKYEKSSINFDTISCGSIKNSINHNSNFIVPPKTINCSPYDVIACEMISVNLSYADKIGEVKGKNDKVIEPVLLGSSIEVSDYIMTGLINYELSKHGCNVPGFKNVNGEMPKSENINFFLSAEIKNINYNIKKKGGNSNETTCLLNIEWKLLNVNKKIIYTMMNSGYSLRQEYGGTEVLNEALTNAFVSLIQDSTYLSKFDKNPKDTSKEDLFPVYLSKVNPSVKSSALSDLVKSSIYSVVTIETEMGHGSGVIVSKDGLIVTNNHVVNGYDKVNVIFANGFSFAGNVIRYNKNFDLALIKIEGNGFSALAFGNSDSTQVGDLAIAIGTPSLKDLGQSVTRGIISGKRIIESKAYLQTDVSISPGNSGGPLIDEKGCIIGIITSKLLGKGVEGIGFAIPSNEVIKILNLMYKD
jgi:S1-C subfamily serine protease